TDAPSYTKIFGDTLVDLAETDPRIVAVSAAMPDGTGLKRFAERFPDRFFDVGIAEQHAVTFAAGMATRGLKPVCAIYSTFLQRAYDNILHDVCLQDLPVTFALDRGGLVGADGPTHHGVFDYSYLRHIPNLVFMVPRDENQLRLAMKTAQNHEGPFAFRYPRGSACGVNISPMRPIPIGQAEKLREGGDGSIFAVGVTVKEALLAAEILAKEGFELAVIDPVYIKPLDRELLKSEAENTGFVITVEENVLQGGFGSAVLESLASDRLTPQVMTIGLPDCFVEQGSQKELRARYGLDAQGIVQKVREILVKN
ncbi:MAG: 1-deoxy-D-xylulose-5-phosphate synthase, partial [Deltaproteobacteria bacterium]|nr:1-deoxy-D-xylulose-5-phosphate synthase [Deltaproteobacteria bacterium]